jgi:hypothetical protein
MGRPHRVRVLVEPPPLPVSTITHRHSKVSEMIFPRRCGAIGRNLVENRGLKHRIQPTPVSHQCGPAVPLSGTPPPPPVGVAPSHPLIDQRSGLEAIVPLRSGKSRPLIRQPTALI